MVPARNGKPRPTSQPGARNLRVPCPSVRYVLATAYSSASREKFLRPRVGEEYVREVPSQWKEEKCRETGRPDDYGYPEIDCEEIEKDGLCEIKYRNFLGLDESPLEFDPEDREPSRIQIVIGSNTYRPEKTIHRTPTKIVLAFTVAPGMVPPGQSRELSIEPPPPQKSEARTVKSGFMGFGKCPGRTDKSNYGFIHRGHEIQSEHPAEKTEYTIDVIIEPSHHNTKTTNPKGGTTHV